MRQFKYGWRFGPRTVRLAFLQFISLNFFARTAEGSFAAPTLTSLQVKKATYFAD